MLKFIFVKFLKSISVLLAYSCLRFEDSAEWYMHAVDTGRCVTSTFCVA